MNRRQFLLGGAAAITATVLPSVSSSSTGLTLDRLTKAQGAIKAANKGRVVFGSFPGGGFYCHVGHIEILPDENGRYIISTLYERERDYLRVDNLAGLPDCYR